MLSTAHVFLAIVGVILVTVGCEPRVDMPRVGSQDSGVLAADTVTRVDANLWTHRPNEKRGVRVTIGIPSGMDSVVIKRAEGEADSVELIEVNSVRVLAPSKLRRISVRSEDGDSMSVELRAKVGHCKRLEFVAVRYWNGGPANGTVDELPQKHELPDCCDATSSGAALDTADAQGGSPTCPSHPAGEVTMTGKEGSH